MRVLNVFAVWTAVVAIVLGLQLGIAHAKDGTSKGVVAPNPTVTAGTRMHGHVMPPAAKAPAGNKKPGTMMGGKGMAGTMMSCPCCRGGMKGGMGDSSKAAPGAGKPGMKMQGRGMMGGKKMGGNGMANMMNNCMCCQGGMKGGGSKMTPGTKKPGAKMQGGSKTVPGAKKPAVMMHGGGMMGGKMMGSQMHGSQMMSCNMGQ